MKKKRNVDITYVTLTAIYWIALVGFTVAYIGFITYECIDMGGGAFYNEGETECYLWFGAVMASLCYTVWKRIKGMGLRLLTAAGFSVATTGGVFFLNNLWKYLCHYFPDADLLYIMKHDLTYSVGWGKFRYPIALICTFFLYSIICTFLTTGLGLVEGDSFGKRVTRPIRRFLIKVLKKMAGVSDVSVGLDDYVSGYVQSRKSYFEMVDYIDDLPANDERTKRELFDAIASYDVEELYEALLDKCWDIMTEEERESVKQRYTDTFAPHGFAPDGFGFDPEDYDFNPEMIDPEMIDPDIFDPDMLDYDTSEQDGGDSDTDG